MKRTNAVSFSRKTLPGCKQVTAFYSTAGRTFVNKSVNLKASSPTLNAAAGVLTPLGFGQSDHKILAV